jgi:predicted alpha/beta hydrolase
MPVSEKAIVHITEHFFGGPVLWNGATGMVRESPVRTHSFVARTGQTILNQDVWDETEGMAEALWESVVNSIDWTRVLLSASVEHMNRQEEDPSHKDHVLGLEVCGDCVAHALLTKEH